jgi:hypothetical protein
MKNVVYRRKVGDLADLRQRIIEAVELIRAHMLLSNVSCYKLKILLPGPLDLWI